MNRLLLVCSGACNKDGGSTISGCNVNGVERQCVSCVSVLSCWVDTYEGELKNTERMCIKCFEVWYRSLRKRGMSPEGRKRIETYIQKRKEEESNAILFSIPIQF